MPITTSDQANDYAIRMHNDEYWSRIYTPDLKGLTFTSCPTSKQSFYKLPVTLKLEREMIADDDLDGPVPRQFTGDGSDTTGNHRDNRQESGKTARENVQYLLSRSVPRFGHC